MRAARVFKVLREDMNKAVQLRGAGDAVALVAKPIAAAIDIVAGTNVLGCGGCAKRQQALNDKISNPLSNG